MIAAADQEDAIFQVDGIARVKVTDGADSYLIEDGKISGTERGLHWTRILDPPCAGPERRVMTALENGLLWFGMFAIPMLIAVMLRRLGRRYGLDDRGDPAQEPDYRRWA